MDVEITTQSPDDLVDQFAWGLLDSAWLRPEQRLRDGWRRRIAL